MVKSMAGTPSNSQTRVKANTGVSAQVFVEEMPKIPQDVKDRFPSMVTYEQNMKDWVRKLNFTVNPR